MSICLSIKDKDNVYFAQDGFFLYTKANMKNENNLGIWTMDDTKHTLFMSSSDMNIITILKRMSLANLKDEQKGIDKSYCIKEILPSLMYYLQQSGVAKSEDGQINDLEANLIIASNDKCYFIGSKGGCREIGEFESYAANESFLYAANDELKDIPILERIALLTFLNERYNTAVIYPIVIRDTKNMQTIFLSREDVANIGNKYFKGETI